MLLGLRILLLATLASSGAQEESGAEATAERLERLLYCGCPRENWTKTLEACIDDCADPQKREIRAWLAAGVEEEEVLARQKDKYGPKVLALADARSNAWIYVLPFLGLVGVGATLYLRLRRRSVAGAGGPPEARPLPGAETIDREIEEELARIE